MIRFVKLSDFSPISTFHKYSTRSLDTLLKLIISILRAGVVFFVLGVIYGDVSHIEHIRIRQIIHSNTRFRCSVETSIRLSNNLLCTAFYMVKVSKKIFSYSG